MATGPRTPVSAPMAAAPHFGLLASVPPATDDTNGRWTNGIGYEPEGCQEGQTLNPCNPAELVPPTKPDSVLWEPYVVSIQEECSTFSDRSERRARAERALLADQERQIGAELFDGAIASTATLPGTITPWPNRWLALEDSEMDILSHSGPVSLLHGLACLEQYLASRNGGQQGMIHATPQVVTHWVELDLVRRDGNRLLTFLDTVVVPSPGYSGNPPNGIIANDNVWAYATDMVRVFLGPVQTFEDEETIDRENNTIVATAQRFALAEWQECRHAGIRLEIELCDIGGS